MKTRFPSILGVFAAILMVASFVVPMNIAAPAAVSADPGIMKWDTVSTPGSVSGQNDLLNYRFPNALALAGFGVQNQEMGSSIIGMANGNDGMTIAYVDRTFVNAAQGAIMSADSYPNVSTVGLNTTSTSSAEWMAWVTRGGTSMGNYGNILYYSTTTGIAATITRTLAILRAQNFPGGATCFQVAIAPDDPKVMVVTTDRGSAFAIGGGQDTQGPTLMWYTTDGGNNWELAFDGNAPIALGGGPVSFATNSVSIRCVDISPDYGGKRDIAFGTVTAGATGHWYCRSSSGFNSWNMQVSPLLVVAGTDVPANFYALKFSPTYSGDSSVALVYAEGTGTYYNVAQRDLNLNNTGTYAFTNPGIKLWNAALSANISPTTATLNGACLQLPSDFSGQSASLRRAYISLDVAHSSAADGVASGIYRVDDTTVYVLMDTTTTMGTATPPLGIGKSIYSIAYFGTYASGKLLAGERYGFSCSATVPTWFTDSPTTCPIPCWYPALKPTTGAANIGCNTAEAGRGGAIVSWNADGSLGYVSTGSQLVLVEGVWYTQLLSQASVNNDESAFAISRNNGETWNQIVLINTTPDWFNDVAVAPDCTTIYLASSNTSGGLCNSYDSVWRATINPNVAAPLPAIPPLGTYWERVYLRPTSSLVCPVGAQSNLPILRLVPSCTDKKDGEIVGWAAQTAATASGGGVMAWSPDYGDYWATITPRFAVQDFAFESSTTLYTVNGFGMVQRLPYTGTSWSTNLPTYQTNLYTAHTIVAVPDGKVLVGTGNGGSYPVSYSADKGVTFDTGSQAISGHGNAHVIFDVDFKNNSFIYMGDDNLNPGFGTVYRNTVPSYQRWTDNDMMAAANGNAYVFANIDDLAWPQINSNPPHIVGQFGLVQAWTGDPQPALYSAHAPVFTSYYYTSTTATGPITTSTTVMSNGGILSSNVTQMVTTTSTTGATSKVSPFNSAVCRTLKPRDGMPKPGIQWACLDIFAPITTTGIQFTLEPTSLKYCGCCTLDTNTTLYAIDDQRGAVIGTVAPLNGKWWNDTELTGNLPAPLTAIGAAAIAARSTQVGYIPALRRGMLWAYTDCLAKKGPILKSPADQFLIGADPVTGRNQQVDLSWEQLCLSTWYQLQVAKDAAFTLRINPAVNTANGIAAVTGSLLMKMDATNMTSPAAWIAPGALPEAGAIYYWRIRSAKSATQQIANSPWSEVRSFTVKAGFIVNTPYYGVQLLAPNNGCIGCKTKPASFSWSPWKEATKYQFDLAKDPEFKTLVVTATTTTTGYEYSGTLDYSTNYFWRVKALEVNGLNIPSDWSATFSMQTEPAPAPPAPPPAEPATPVWVWVIIAIGAILVIVTLVLIFKTRRV